MVYRDFSNAFDAVLHDLLLNKVEKYNWNRTTIKLQCHVPSSQGREMAAMGPAQIGIIGQLLVGSCWQQKGCKAIGGFPLFKPDVISQLEQEEEPWAPNFQGSEEREILRGSCMGEGMVRETVEQTPQQEEEQVEARGALLQRCKGSVSRSCEQGKGSQGQHRPEKRQGNQPAQKVGISVHYRETHKGLKEATARQRILMGERNNTGFESGKQFRRCSHHQRFHTGVRPYGCC
ncbi:zinc finger protein 2-like isoform X2 [Gopherus flavomarginatus]|uniref:zinc finger protein 2-like isoform X2 n=1 Tax=Gopherus flavomarginatus TaxID=286002 RepID=UPI0021CBA4D5|nr:zinc finger protein 2-like isoform X2 [Gopherus flavomarginatus]